RDEARSHESEHDPSAAGREDEPAQPGQEWPEQASGALGSEVERQAQAEEAVGGAGDAQVHGADFQDLGGGGEKTPPSRREESGAPSPIPSVTPAASAAPVQATRCARAPWPAPMFVPTIVTSAEPKPKTSGIWRYSSRTPTPYPASAKVPKDPTRAVSRTTVRFVWTLLTRLGAPTRRISRNRRRSKPTVRR